MPTRERTGVDPEGLFLLWAARKTGVLDALTGHAGTPAEVAAAAGVTTRAAEVTVDALADMGFLERVGEEYEPTNRLLGFLAIRDLRSVGALPHALDLLDAYTSLPGTMVTGEAPAWHADWRRHELGAHAATDEARVRAAVTAAVRAHPDATRVLDVLGGSGVYAREFAARGFDVTLVDDPEVVEAVEPMLANSEVTLEAGSLPALAGAGFDLAFAADCCRALSPAENRHLLTAVSEALEPGRTLVLVEALGGRSTAAPAVAVEGLATGAGGAYEAATYRSWLADAGFGRVEVRDVPGTDRQAVVARKRAVE